jgi:aryl-alcohol dehydrogenase-like predicted oxidoreductase
LPSARRVQIEFNTRNIARSLSEIERFAADLKSNAALRAEAEKAQADKSHATPLQRAAAFATSKGYAFTTAELKEHAKATAKAAGKQLTDAELDGVAGGNSGSQLGGNVGIRGMSVKEDDPDDDRSDREPR